MLPQNLSVVATDVLTYQQKKERVSERSVSDPSYFRTAFKRKVGKTIREYLKENTAFKQ